MRTLRIIAISTLLASCLFADVPLSVAPLDLGPVDAGSYFYYHYQATGGTLPYTWSITKGMLPTGALIFPSGTIEADRLAVAGKWEYELTVKDASGAIAKAIMTFAVVNPPILSQDNANWIFRGRWNLWASRGAVAGSLIGDWYSTEKCVHLPGGVCTENNQLLLNAGINPATKSGSEKLLTLKIAGPLVNVLWQEIARRKHWVATDKTLTIINYAFAAGQTGVDIHNRYETVQLSK